MTSPPFQDSTLLKKAFVEDDTILGVFMQDAINLHKNQLHSFRGQSAEAALDTLDDVGVFVPTDELLT